MAMAGANPSRLNIFISAASALVLTSAIAARSW